MASCRAPHRAQPGAVQRQRHRHAVHHRGGVEVGAHRDADVVLEPARRLDVDHQQDAAGSQGPVDVLQHARRLRLIVDGVEHGDHVVGLDACPAGSDCGSRRSRSSGPRSAASAHAGRDGLFGEVDAGEPAGRKRLGHQVDRMTTAATEVGDIGAGAQAFRRARRPTAAPRRSARRRTPRRSSRPSARGSAGIRCRAVRRPRGSSR